jgi:hypothetical protein
LPPFEAEKKKKMKTHHQVRPVGNPCVVCIGGWVGHKGPSTHRVHAALLPVLQVGCSCLSARLAFVVSSSSLSSGSVVCLYFWRSRDQPGLELPLVLCCLLNDFYIANLVIQDVVSWFVRRAIEQKEVSCFFYPPLRKKYLKRKTNPSIQQ